VHRKAVTDKAGGWRHYRDLHMDPDTEVWSRLATAGARMQSVPRLTVVKFPAATRQNVYGEKPFHEQAHWLARIQTESEFEQVELGSMLIQAIKRSRAKPFSGLLKEVLERATQGTARRLVAGDPNVRQRRFFERRLRFKGAAAVQRDAEGDA
jgi:hypothetical protein